MRKIKYLLIISALFAACQKPEPTEIQIFNERPNEKTFNFGITTYFGEKDPIYNVEHVRIEHGEMCDVLISCFKQVSSDGITRFDWVDEIIIPQIAANSVSNPIEIERCDRVEILYRTYSYNRYYRNSVEVATERTVFDQTAVFDNIRNGRVNKLTIKD